MSEATRRGRVAHTVREELKDGMTTIAGFDRGETEHRRAVGKLLNDLNDLDDLPLCRFGPAGDREIGPDDVAWIDRAILWTLAGFGLVAAAIGATVLWVVL